MRLQILDSARDDLIEGFYFYEKQKSGLGDYFLTSLYSDMEAHKILFGIHLTAYRGFTGRFRTDFHSPFTTPTTRKPL